MRSYKACTLMSSTHTPCLSFFLAKSVFSDVRAAHSIKRIEGRCSFVAPPVGGEWDGPSEGSCCSVSLSGV